MPGDLADRVLQVIRDREMFFDALDTLPQTFCHLDAFPRNLSVRNEGVEDLQIVAIDWEFAGVSALGAELAPLVGGSVVLDELDLADADELEKAVFAAYLSGLRDTGWQVDAEIVRLGYALALVLNYVFIIVSVVVEGALKEDVRQIVEQRLHRPYMAQMEHGAKLLEFLLARADEARKLLGIR